MTLNYDPATRLYETVGGSTTRRAYDGDNLIADYNGSNTLQSRYVFGPGGEPLVRYDVPNSSARSYFHEDERGSVIAQSNNSGAMASINSYDEYGIPASGNTGRFQYTGQQWLGALGMYHYRARTYSPTHGRFMQTDPISFAGGMNLGAYARNDPINLTDPSGLDPAECLGNDPWCTDFAVTGTRLHQAGHVTLAGAAGRYMWDMPLENGTGSGGDMLQCVLADGAITMTFDGATITLSGEMQLDGPGAATSQDYPQAISSFWTRDLGNGMSIVTNITPGTNGLIGHVSAGTTVPEGTRGLPEAYLGGREMWLGNLGAAPLPGYRDTMVNIAGHEFGHPLNLIDRYTPGIGTHPGYVGSIMGDGFNGDVDSRTARDLIEACREAAGN